MSEPDVTYQGDLRANSSRGAFHSPQTPHMRGLQWKVGTASLVRAWVFLDLYEENRPHVKHNYTITETETRPGFKPQWFVVSMMCSHLLGTLVSSPSLLLLLCLFPLSTMVNYHF